MVDYPKIKSAVKVIFLLTIMILSQAGCTRVVIYPSEETATAMAANSSIDGVSPLTPQGNSAVGAHSPDATQSSAQLLTTEPLQSTPMPTGTERPPVLYNTLSGDTLDALASRFAVDPDQIISSDSKKIPAGTILEPDQLLIIPSRLNETGPSDPVIPDSEIVFSPSAVDFNTANFVQEAGGYLTTYKEWRTDGWYNGAQIIDRVAYENSINPRILLAILEYQSHWVYGEPTNLAETDYPIGWKEFEFRGLYKQLSWAVTQLSIGYYGWRTGSVTDLTFLDDTILRIAPGLNAGSVAVQYLFSKLYNQRDWGGAIYSPEGLMALHENMFGNSWLRANTVEPLFPPDISQPDFILPFEKEKVWNFTGGPHAAWGPDGVLAALDFAPPSIDHGCVTSNEWVTAAAPGLIVRSGNGIVVIDLDGDGYEQTGWVLFFLHISHTDRIAAGTWVNQGDPIGHPSCEGGVATGTHFHLARKYNGEWIPADGPLSFVMSGWRAYNGDKPYEGTLTKDDLVVTAHVYGDSETRISQ